MDTFSQQQIKIEELEKRLNSLSKKLKIESNEIDAINANLTTTSQKINALSTELDTQDFDSWLTYTKRWGINNVRHDRIFFTCKPYVKTKIKIKTDLFFISNSTTALTAYIRICLNTINVTKGKIYEEKFEITEGTLNTTFEFEYDFYPTKVDNTFLLLVNAGTDNYTLGSSGITSYEVTIFGKDVNILTRNNDFKVFLSKDNYYITRNVKDYGEYLIAPVTSVNLSSTFTTIESVIDKTTAQNNDKFLPFSYTCVPNISYDSTTERYEISTILPPRFYYYYSNANTLYIGQQNPSSGTTHIACTYGYSYTVGPPISTSLYYHNVGSANTTLDCYLSYGVGTATKIETKRMKLNGSNVTGMWVENCVVFVKNWEDLPAGEIQPCYVATNSLGEVYFFDGRLATYTLYIGKGSQVNAYMQSDRSINVYMRRKHNVYKKVLLYDSASGVYSVQDGEQEIPNALEYIEGMNGDYFINNLGTWEYHSA